MPLPRRRNCWPDWVPAGIVTWLARAVDGRHLDLATERGGRHRDWDPALQVRAVALKNACDLTDRKT